MKMELTIALDKPYIASRDYRRIFISLIKSAINNYAEGILLNKVYYKTVQKDFTWSVIFDKPKFDKAGINLDSNVLKFILSAYDNGNIGYHLYMAFQGVKNKKLPLPDGNNMTVKNVKLVNQHMIGGNVALFRSVVGSPFVVREHRRGNKDVYYTAESSLFKSKLADALKRQAILAGFNEDVANELEVRNVCTTKNVVLNYGIYIDANVGMLEIKANPMILQYFYQAGISAHRSSGFGMLDLVEQRNE